MLGKPLYDLDMVCATAFLRQGCDETIKNSTILSSLFLADVSKVFEVATCEMFEPMPFTYD
ncbi:hypothetical protein TH4_20990 [Thalassospira tepidiphila MCCC 1A03514]|uniref:Uncharacterized protein n=1 Tax=Thalassospira tepidiphila MCCC 1A03514 TaxID=1177930 RepID=A0A853KUF7_9PROT|nr:hypothetical protein TH4_20990 [Thalassospira tepidiphila MCCC 1A03514]